MKIVETRESPYVFTKEGLSKIKSKFNKLKLVLVDSYGYYSITGSRETVNGFDYVNQLSKLILFLDRELNIYTDTITHGETMYFIFRKP